jgi:hypothetical protein
VLRQNDLSTPEGMERSVRSARSEATRWAYADGLADFSVGAVFLAIAGLAALDARVSEDSPLAGLMAFGLPIVMLAAIALGRVVTPMWRQRVTYRRTGYAALRQPHRGRYRLIVPVAAGALASLVAMLVVTHPAATEWILLLQGIAVGGIFALIGLQGGADRFLALGVISVVLGGLLTAWAPREEVGNFCFYGCLGLAALVSGTLVLRGYLRRPLALEA